MIGPVINIVPFRIKIDNNERIIDFINRIQIKSHKIIKNSLIPLIEIKKIPNCGYGEELFETLFSMESYPSYLKERNNVISIPSGFIKKDRKGNYVKVDRHGKEEKKYLEIGEEIGGNVIIKNNLSAGDVIYD